MKKITAKFNSKCHETGKPIKKGDSMYYDYANKKAYHTTSIKAQSCNTDDDLSGFIDAQENAYFDKFNY